MSPVRSMAAGTTLLALLAGCGGQALDTHRVAAPSITSRVPIQGTPTQDNKPGTQGGLANVRPCELLEQAETAALRLSGGEEKRLGAARVCSWHREGATLWHSFSVILAVFENQGLSDLNAENIRQLTNIGTHKASSFVDSSGACGIAIVVSEVARVDASALGGDEQEACRLASQLASRVEPRLP
jgi:hypothetical protein